MRNPSETLMELGRRLAAARKARKVSLESLAAKSGVPSARLREFERGSLALGMSELLHVSRVLHVPLGPLLDAATPMPKDRPSMSVMLRAAGTSSLTRPDLENLERGLREAQDFRSLGDLMGMRAGADGFRPVKAPAAKAYLPGYELARRVRALLQNRDEPLWNLQGMLEDKMGILVAPMVFQRLEITGAACRLDNARLVAVGKPGLSDSAQLRFLLAHELCHHLADLGAAGAATVDTESRAAFSMEKAPAEQRADAFAAMLLVPETGVARLVGPPQKALALKQAKQLVDRVAPAFGVPMGVAVWHLHSLKYFSKDVASGLWQDQPRVLVQVADAGPTVSGLERRLEMALDAAVISVGRAREIRRG